MTKGLLFWILMIVWLVFGIWNGWPLNISFSGTGLLFIVIGLLGWQVFGSPVK